MVEIGLDDVLLLGTDGIGDPLGAGHGGVGNLFREVLGGSSPSLIEFAHAVDFSREYLRRRSDAGGGLAARGHAKI